MANNIKTYEMVVTPKTATEMLKHQGKNRLLKPTVVSQYANDMKQGRWKYSPEPISFDENGYLLDGQHRLMAVIKSGTPITLMIAENVSRDVPFDTHKQRTTSDSLLYAGYITEDVADHHSLAIVNAFLKIRVGGPKFNELSRYDKGDLLMKYKDEIKTTKSISWAGTKKAVLKIANRQSSILTAIILGYDVSELYKFAETVNTALVKNDNPGPGLVLHKMLTDKEVKYTRSEIASIIEQAIVDTFKGKDRQRSYDASKVPPLTSELPLKEVMA